MTPEVRIRKAIGVVFRKVNGVSHMNQRLIAVSALLIVLESGMAQMTAFAMPRAMAEGRSKTIASPGWEISQATQQPLPPASTSKPTAPLTFGLEDGHPIKVKLKEEISSKTAQTNQTILFEVADDVVVDGKVVIAKGALAKGYVAKAKPSGMLGQKGKLDIAVKEVTLVSDERVGIRAGKDKGGGTSASVVALAAVISPFFLLMKGKNVTYTAGTELDVFIDGNYELDPSKFNVSGSPMLSPK
jgi:hypothetical protein